MFSDSKIAIIGSGSWATALAKILISKNHSINWYFRNPENIRFFEANHHNPSYLCDVLFDMSKITLYNDLDKIAEESDILIMVIPSAFLKESLSKLTVDISKKFIVSAIKGIVPDDNLIVGKFINQQFNVPLDSIGIIAGPCHAEEVALERLSYLTIACPDVKKARAFALMIESSYIRAHISDDIYGTEYSSVIKNIIAIASGICNGLHYGDNFQAVLVSNAIQEIKRFVDKVHPITRDIKGSSYLGDLLVTAYSQFSRNRLFGTMIGKGYSIRSAQLEMHQVAEGYYAVKCIKEINQEHNVNMPICDAVYNICYENISPAIEILLLTENLR
ncbi:MAG TPA: NAD(P)H-dependent glycerol-3-phosphate dehydrogenase [Prolixibacteraceae bacterium]|nr:NAD(P)H-dependent glycerol-3-phosphate dehydrogenase [Bacteroidales bacterium]HPB05346.1 NAD(P)H-dependent glycerol-3-phosphate dehydrogenase [Prolixibacteraceae bacterium]HQN93037.1 NAD(P)H-dependent glycerol-3-phosphate dehydrogenase [Prolixibacteraceae bacterium]HUM88123.1 NAD(P)H-dependent glycerol-3-phosphate dehydrogenase [Prolixibacteraceae bacterium]